MRVPQDRVWQDSSGRFYDPYRPAIEPNGFDSAEALLTSREELLSAVRSVVEDSDVFVFTLGLTETWRNRADGSIYPVVPGAIAGTFDPEQHEFVNLSFAEVRQSLLDALALFRDRNKSINIVLTVSPVPLVATYKGSHVLSATTYSKSLLRVVAEEVAQTHDWVTYFPSYEIITGHYNAGLYFEPDMRNVSMRGVQHVMRNFMHELTPQSDGNQEQDQVHKVQSESRFNDIADLVCEENALDD